MEDVKLDPIHLQLVNDAVAALAEAKAVVERAKVFVERADGRHEGVIGTVARLCGLDPKSPLTVNLKNGVISGTKIQ